MRVIAVRTVSLAFNIKSKVQKKVYKAILSDPEVSADRCFLCCAVI